MKSSLAIVTLRVPRQLLDRGRSLARRRGLSLNALLREALEDALESERQAVLATAYDDLGRDQSESDVEPFLVAQAEVAARD
jgi:hypothetical protein